MERMTKQLTRRTDDAEAGAFIGFDSSNESDLSEDEVQSIYTFYILIRDGFLEALHLFRDSKLSKPR